MRRFMTLGIGVILCTVGHPSPAIADEILSNGNAFLSRCSAVTQARGDPLDFGFCFGYLKGILDRDEMFERKVCVPSEVTNGQIMDVVLKYMREHPESRHLNPGVQALVALHGPFPCQPPSSKQ